MGKTAKTTARQTALAALLGIERGAFADEALQRSLTQSSISALDRQFVTELVYGVTRRRRILDALIQHLATAKRDRPPQLIHLILRLGLYQLRYLNQVPASAAVNTSVELAKENGLGGLAGFVNGLLRTYVRLGDPPLAMPPDPISQLGIMHSYPDWILALWVDQFSQAQGVLDGDPLKEVELLCHWFNQPPSIDLRVNILQASVEQVQKALDDHGVTARPIPPSPQGLRLESHAGAIQALPGYTEGWWTVQDGGAQLVSYLLDPQPGETIIDVCAAPGGKTTHIAELMGDRGILWACDRNSKRLKRVQENIERLNLQSINLLTHDMRSPHASLPQADRVLVDAPCSGLGTLHRHADARWRQSPDRIAELSILQQEILHQASTVVKLGGYLVYATCTLHPQENEVVIQSFLDHHPQWAIAPVPLHSPLSPYQSSEGWLTIWPHHHNLDGFFMVRLQRLE